MDVEEKSVADGADGAYGEDGADGSSRMRLEAGCEGAAVARYSEIKVEQQK